MPVLQVAHLNLVFPGGAALWPGSCARLPRGRNRRSRKFSAAVFAFVCRLAHQAFQISAGVTPFNVAGLFGFPGFAAASDNDNDYARHDPDVRRRRTADQLALDEFWRNRSEAKIGSNLCDPSLRRPDILDLSCRFPVQ